MNCDRTRLVIELPMKNRYLQGDDYMTIKKSESWDARNSYKIAIEQ